MSIADTATNPFFHRIYNCKDADECRNFYDEWAQTYDAELAEDNQNYVGPVLTAQTIVKNGGNLQGTIMDAGCGTGLCGAALQQLGAKTIDGVDLSQGMLDVARKTGAYRNLDAVDLSKPMVNGTASYDVVACVGTFTAAHVKPQPAMEEFVRITKKGGLVVATVLGDIYESGGYEAEVKRLGAKGVVDVVSTEPMDYRKGAGVQARMVVMRKK